MSGQLSSVQIESEIFSGLPLEAFAVAAPGLAPLVADELGTLGIASPGVERGGVSFRATPAQLFAANLHSRIASRVIVRVASFAAREFAALERKVRKVRWRSFVGSSHPVRLHVTSRKSRLFHTGAVAERVARVIEGAIDGVRVTLDSAPDEEADRAQLILVRLERDLCTISADTSGELLHRRGWRQAVAKAPLRETLAAAMISAAGWSAEEALVDPFCGSGTIGIEAALRLRRIAPGRDRNFAMEDWPGAPSALFRQLREEAISRELENVDATIVLSDRDGGAVEAALANAERAGVADSIRVVQRSLSDVDLHSLGSHGLVLTNPPYGVRVSGETRLRRLYSKLGDVIRGGGPGWRLGFLAPEERSGVPLGMSVRIQFRTSNGGIPVAMQMASQKRGRDRVVRQDSDVRS